MPESTSDDLQKKIEERLRYYEDLGICLFYKDRAGGEHFSASVEPNAVASSTIVLDEEISLRKTASQVKTAERVSKLAEPPIHLTTAGALFAEVEKVKDDTLLKIREDIGECTRCKLHKGRNKIVFGDGNPKAKLVFVGEAPGADEDKQGIPFVGRAGKLLTQMIEAMGLPRQDVYICNVVKCRPPENRKPEDDEVSTCSPYLLRQLNVIEPKVLVCLGAVAAQTLLATNRGISQFRGQWMDWHGHKLMATYHPAYLLRNPAAKSEVWKDLQKVMAELGLQVPKKAKS
jgi:uracil-DNA glycosylase